MSSMFRKFRKLVSVDFIEVSGGQRHHESHDPRHTFLAEIRRDWFPLAGFASA
jgi:hypothetical protein